MYICHKWHYWPNNKIIIIIVHKKFYLTEYTLNSNTADVHITDLILIKGPFVTLQRETGQQMNQGFYFLVKIRISHTIPNIDRDNNGYA